MAGQTIAAETLALEALAWLARSGDLIEVFLRAGGLSGEDVQERLSDPDFLAAVLDFLLLDDDWILGFAAESGHDPAEVARARQALPGGQGVHWT